MEIETLRDVVIIVSGIMVTLAIIFVAVIVYVVFHKINRILKFATTVATKIEALTTLATDEIGKPLIQLAGIIQGVACGIRGINNIFKQGG